MDRAVNQLGSGMVAHPHAVGLPEVLHVLGKWRAVIALVVVAAVGTAGVFSFFILPKIYRASATVNVAQLLAPSGGNAGGTNQTTDLQGQINAATSQPTATMPTLIWEVSSPAMLQTAATSLGTGTSPGALAGMVSAAQVQSTDLLTISATNHDPRMAAAIANAVANAFVTKEGDAATGYVGQGLDRLVQQAAAVRGQLDTASAALAQAEEQPGASASTAAVVSADSQQLASLTSEYAQAQVDLQAGIGAQNSLKASLVGLPPTISTTSGGSLPSQPSTGQPNPEYQALTQNLATQQVQLAKDQATAQALYQQELGYNYSAEPAAYLAAKQAFNAADVVVKGDQAAIGALQIELARTPLTLPPPPPSAPSVTVAPNPLYQQLSQSLDSQEVTVAQDRAKADELAKQIPPLKDQLTALETQSTSAQAAVNAAQSRVNDLTATYQTLTKSITNAQVSQAISGKGSPVQLDAPAAIPGAPIAPKKKLNVMLGFLLGLVAGCVLAFILEQFDNTIKSADDVRRVVGLPTLAVIPFVRSS